MQVIGGFQSRDKTAMSEWELEKELRQMGHSEDFKRKKLDLPVTFRKI